MQQPDVWHHGLVARFSGEFWSTHLGPEAAYFQSLIETSGQPALDTGCGVGRLLVPYLQAGLDVDGCDYSADMLAECAARARRAGLSPRLYRQAMHELDLPRRYMTMFACGVIGLGGERRLTMEGLRRCYEHLRPGGTFAFDFAPRWNDPPAFLSRLAENRHALPQEWPPFEERKTLPDGTEIEIAVRTVSVDPLEETQTRQMRARLWRNGELLQEETQTMRYDEYGINELMLVLQHAGFSDVQIFGNYTAEPATSDHTDLVFVARK